MATIVTRAGKGSPLTNNEVDANFTNLNSDKVETSAISTFGGTLIDDADAATARTTLGLGTAAVQNDDRYAHRANNLSDLADAATARTNLGLGSAATSAATDFVAQSSATGSAEIPTGTEAQRDGAPSAGYFRFNTDSSSFEGYDGTAWGAIGGSVDLSAVDQDIIPDADSTRDIGSTTKRWAQGWFDDVTAATADINGGTIDGTVIGGSTPAAISGTTGTFSGDLIIADKIVHDGDTNTAIRFPAADTVTVETAGSERVRVDSSGSLLVGTPTSSVGRIVSAGNVAGSIYTLISDQSLYGTGVVGHILFTNGNGSVGSITTSGSSTSYNTSSDYRLKEDVQPMVGASDRVLALNPVNFAWKADGSRVDGFLAHEAQAVVPEAITGTKDDVDADGNPVYQGIDQSKLVPLLTAALQEALARIETLEADVAALKGEPA